MATGGLRDRIVRLVLNAERHPSGVIADAILAELEEAERLGPKGNAPPEPLEEPQTEEERLLQIDPHELSRVDAQTMGKFLALQFPALKPRFEELHQGALAWQAAHKGPRGEIIPLADRDECDALSERMSQIRDFAGPDGEVDSARKECKRQIYDAILALDAWFKAMCEPLADIHGPSKRPPIGSMQWHQDAFLTAEAQRLQREQQAAAAAAAEQARQAAEEARRLAETEAARIAALEAAGHAPEEATQLAAAETDAAAEQADQVMHTSALIGSQASSPGALVKSTNASGITTGLRGTWDFDETQVDMRTLCKGVADGTVPITFVTVVPQAIRQAIRAKINPMRACPGLVITQTHSASRRAGR